MPVAITNANAPASSSPGTCYPASLAVAFTLCRLCSGHRLLPRIRSSIGRLFIGLIDVYVSNRSSPLGSALSAPRSSARGAKALIELAEGGAERFPIVAKGGDDAQQPAFALGREPQQPHPPVVARRLTNDESRLLCPVDQLGDCGLLQVEQLAKLGHSQLSCRSDHQQQVVPLRRQAGLSGNRLRPMQETAERGAKRCHAKKL